MYGHDRFRAAGLQSTGRNMYLIIITIPSRSRLRGTGKAKFLQAVLSPSEGDRSTAPEHLPTAVHAAALVLRACHMRVAKEPPFVNSARGNTVLHCMNYMLYIIGFAGPGFVIAVWRQGASR